MLCMPSRNKTTTRSHYADGKTHRVGKPWRARVRVDGKQDLYLGVFDTYEEAAQAEDDWRAKRGIVKRGTRRAEVRTEEVA